MSAFPYGQIMKKPSYDPQTLRKIARDEKTYSDEFDWVIPKPFGLQALLDAVENLIGHTVTSWQDSPDSVNQPTQNV